MASEIHISIPSSRGSVRRDIAVINIRTYDGYANYLCPLGSTQEASVHTHKINVVSTAVAPFTNMV